MRSKAVVQHVGKAQVLSYAIMGLASGIAGLRLVAATFFADLASGKLAAEQADAAAAATAAGGAAAATTAATTTGASGSPSSGAVVQADLVTGEMLSAILSGLTDEETAVAEACADAIVSLAGAQPPPDTKRHPRPLESPAAAAGAASSAAGGAAAAADSTSSVDIDAPAVPAVAASAPAKPRVFQPSTAQQSAVLDAVAAFAASPAATSHSIVFVRVLMIVARLCGHRTGAIGAASPDPPLLAECIKRGLLAMLLQSAASGRPAGLPARLAATAGDGTAAAAASGASVADDADAAGEPDALMQLTLLELLPPIAASPAGFCAIVTSGVLAKLLYWSGISGVEVDALQRRLVQAAGEAGLLPAAAPADAAATSSLADDDTSGLQAMLLGTASLVAVADIYFAAATSVAAVVTRDAAAVLSPPAAAAAAASAGGDTTAAGSRPGFDAARVKAALSPSTAALLASFAGVAGVLRGVLVDGLFDAVAHRCTSGSDIQDASLAIQAVCTALAADAALVDAALAPKATPLTREWLENACSTTPELKVAALQGLARVFDTANAAALVHALLTVDAGTTSPAAAPAGTPLDLERYRKLWERMGAVCGADAAGELLLATLRKPVPEARLAAFGLLAAVASVPAPWALRGIVAAGDLCAYLLDRSTEDTKAGKEWKFGVVHAVLRNPCAHEALGDFFLTQFRTFYRKGPYFVDMAGPAVKVAF